jgi:hypothetical protein
MIAVVIAVALGMAVFVTPALSWEKGTHLYFADKLKRQGGGNPMNFDEMYGAMAPDIFNYVFLPPFEVYSYLYGQTHGQYQKMWQAVKWGWEKPLAFGFVSHNDTWGADYTAHHRALTLASFPGDGYIITKARALVLGLNDYWAGIEALIGPIDYSIKLELCHNIVEAAGDVILRKFYPQLGKNLVAAGSRSDKRFRNLFVKAYLPDLMTMFPLLSEDIATGMLLSAESAFRSLQVKAYGFVLNTLDDTALVDWIAEQFDDMLGDYLISRKVIPPGSVLPDMTPVIQAALGGAIALIENDYMLEVDATVNYLRAEMKRRKFWASTKKGDIF